MYVSAAPGAGNERACAAPGHDLSDPVEVALFLGSQLRLYRFDNFGGIGDTRIVETAIVGEVFVVVLDPLPISVIG